MEKCTNLSAVGDDDARRDTHIRRSVYTMAELRREVWEKAKKRDII